MAIFSLTPWEKVDDDIDHNHQNFICSSDKFIEQGIASIAYWPDEAGAYYKIFKSIRVGDIIYLKQPEWEARKIHIDAIGFVVNNELEFGNLNELRTNTIKVHWCRINPAIEININETAEHLDRGDPYSSRIFGITLYEEFNPHIQSVILSVLGKLMPKSFKDGHAHSLSQ